MDSLAIVRMNPMSNGHKYLLETMLSESDNVYLGLGSCQESRTEKNPFNKDEREFMIRQVFPNNDKLHLFFLNDLGPCSKKEWNDYCLNQLHKQISKDANPTVYYGGCDVDVEWWSEAVNLEGNPIKIISLNREDNEHLSATVIRKSLSNFLNGKILDINWFRHIPDENVEYVKDNYPRSLL